MGKELWEIGLIRDEGESREAFRTLQETVGIRYEDLPLESKDGTRREVEFVSNVYREGDRDVIQCNIRDITDRMLMEQERGQNRRRQRGHGERDGRTPEARGRRRAGRLQRRGGPHRRPRHRPEVILLDIGLPGVDGYELASRLRQVECGRDAILIALTGDSDADARQRSEESGFDHHLVKPVDFDALLALIDRPDVVLFYETRRRPRRRAAHVVGPPPLILSQ